MIEMNVERTKRGREYKTVTISWDDNTVTFGINDSATRVNGQGFVSARNLDLLPLIVEALRVLSREKEHQKLLHKLIVSLGQHISMMLLFLIPRKE